MQFTTEILGDIPEASLVAQTVKKSACNAGEPLGWKIPWRREWLPTPALLPGESHGRRSLVSCSPGGCKELDTTERLTLSRSTSQRVHILPY